MELLENVLVEHALGLLDYSGTGVAPVNTGS